MKREHTPRREIMKQAIDIIHTAARGRGVSRGAHARDILEDPHATPIFKSAALIVKTRELIKKDREG